MNISAKLMHITEAGRSPKASVGATAASEARIEEGLGGGGAGPGGFGMPFSAKVQNFPHFEGMRCFMLFLVLFFFASLPFWTPSFQNRDSEMVLKRLFSE